MTDEKHEGGIGDEAIQPRYHNVMNALASVIDDTLNGFPQLMPAKLRRRKTGFILLVFPFGEDADKRCNYVSTAQREDVIKLLREQLKRFEADKPKKGKKKHGNRPNS